MNTLDRELYKQKLRREKKYKDVRISVHLVMTAVGFFFISYTLSLFFQDEIINKIFKMFTALIVFPLFFNATTFFYYSRLKIKIEELIFSLFLFLLASLWFSFSIIGKIISIEFFNFFKHPVISVAFIIFLFLLFIGLIVKTKRDKVDELKYLKKKYNRES